MMTYIDVMTMEGEDGRADDHGGTFFGRRWCPPGQVTWKTRDEANGTARSCCTQDGSRSRRGRSTLRPVVMGAPETIVCHRPRNMSTLRRSNHAVALASKQELAPLTLSEKL